MTKQVRKLYRRIASRVAGASLIELVLVISLFAIILGAIFTPGGILDKMQNEYARWRHAVCLQNLAVGPQLPTTTLNAVGDIVLNSEDKLMAALNSWRLIKLDCQGGGGAGGALPPDEDTAAIITFVQCIESDPALCDCATAANYQVVAVKCLFNSTAVNLNCGATDLAGLVGDAAIAAAMEEQARENYFGSGCINPYTNILFDTPLKGGRLDHPIFIAPPTEMNPFKPPVVVPSEAP